tara:strand:+ start:236 stop:565 length:330 start_codon:yes stop_codon:yes gene_type:complete
MSSQIFKKNIPIQILIDFLEINCEKSNNIFKFDKISFKKAEFHGNIDEFIEKISPFYHESKKFYLTRNINYNNLVTIIRQICKYLKIKYFTKIIYDKSKYDIIYNICID